MRPRQDPNLRPSAQKAFGFAAALPWSGPEGKPCSLSTDDRGGYMSRLADNIESEQLDTAVELLKRAAETFGDEPTSLGEIQLLAKELTAALHDVLRVATSRGHLLARSEAHDL